jgi:hypothetical protein
LYSSDIDDAADVPNKSYYQNDVKRIHFILLLLLTNEHHVEPDDETISYLVRTPDSVRSQDRRC